MSGISSSLLSIPQQPVVEEKTFFETNRLNEGDQETFGNTEESFLIILFILFWCVVGVAYIGMVGVYFYMEYLRSKEDKNQAMDQKFAEDRNDIINQSNRMPSMSMKQL